MVLPWLRKQMTTTLDDDAWLCQGELSEGSERMTPMQWKEHAFETDPEQHRFKSLPLMNNRASDINSLEMRPTLSQLHADLKSFEHHFAWLSRASRKHHHPALPKLGQMMSLIKSLTSMLEHQMMRVDAQRLSPPSPSMPPPPPSQFDVLQSSQELLLQFRLFCDWAQRVFSVLSTKSKMSAVQ
ncbi:uncharacterized protein il11a isoform 3-T4 [Salvelinus alpinus]